MESLQDIGTVLGRIITIMPLLLIIALFMGRRAIGEMPVFDFLIVITLGSVTGADIADPDISHLPTAVAIAGIGVLQRITSTLKLRNRYFSRLITFEPVVVVKNGLFLKNNMKQIRYSVDNILHMMREQGIFDPGEVDTAVIEGNGALSVLKKDSKLSPSLEDLSLPKVSPSLSYPVIVEGQVYTNVLDRTGFTEEWLQDQLTVLGIPSPEQVFFACMNHKGELHVSRHTEGPEEMPGLFH
ncbi:DUF421 domain-containing protein [Alteribacter natronophilus]|uniref:DUF421 domain-containing protein n=1 Tax=Alteribacter natronophilus TaxID=2583810 RepID=UPI00110D3B70|nr:DUF421 domain-containing protein [Alteribacter natronophilus]TMW72060.1 DUF421 domain-containing protein [Alteribacter natronophilus]